MTIRLLIAYLLNLFDLLCTNYWIKKFGLDIEANPVGRWLYQNHLAVPVKVFGIGALLLILHNAVKHRDKGLEKSFQWWDVASWAALGVYGVLAAYHIILAVKIAIITKGGI